MIFNEESISLFRFVQVFTKDPLKVDRKQLQNFGNADVKNKSVK